MVTKADAGKVGGSPPGGERRPGARDAWLALGLFSALGAAYWLLFQGRMYGDGPGLVTFFVEGSGQAYHHVLYLPVLGLLRELAPWAGPLAAPGLASVFGGALGAGGAFLVARAFGSGRQASAAAAVLAGLSSVGLFFSTCVEVYAVHLGAVAVCAVVTLYGGWDRPARALLAAALFFPLMYWTHSIAALYGPGWVALAAHARSRRGPPLGRARVLFVVGPVLLAALLSAMAIATLYRSGRLGLDIGREAEIVALFEGVHSYLAFLRSGWLVPLGLLVPLAAIGAWRMRAEPLALFALGALVLLPLAFLTWWSVPERGGYVLGQLPFYAALAARGIEWLRSRWPRPARWVVPLLVALQAGAAAKYVGDWDRGFDPADRVELIRANVGVRGTVVSAHFAAPDIHVHLPGVVEHDLFQRPAAEAAQNGVSPDDFAEAFLPFVDEHLLLGPLALDLAHRRMLDHRGIASVAPYVEALAEALRARYETRFVEDPWWPLLVVVPPENP